MREHLQCAPTPLLIIWLMMIMLLSFKENTLPLLVSSCRFLLSSFLFLTFFLCYFLLLLFHYLFFFGSFVIHLPLLHFFSFSSFTCANKREDLPSLKLRNSHTSLRQRAFWLPHQMPGQTTCWRILLLSWVSCLHVRLQPRPELLNSTFLSLPPFSHPHFVFYLSPSFPSSSTLSLSPSLTSCLIIE